MRQRENILEVASLHPDYLGFIFYNGSKRFVGNDFELPPSLPTSVKKIGVFVNAPSQEIHKLVDQHLLDFVQLHGDEPPEQCAGLRSSRLKVIKAFRIGHDFDFEALSPYREVVDYFLFDAKGKDFGGNGVAFDWTTLRKYDQSVPFFLSGGISVLNIKEVSTLVGMNLHALDVNSGVEQEVGMKDVELVRRLMDIKFE